MVAQIPLPWSSKSKRLLGELPNKSLDPNAILTDSFFEEQNARDFFYCIEDKVKRLGFRVVS